MGGRFHARGHRHAAGQATVEFALSSVVLVFLLLGLLDFARGFYFAVRLQDAAREGARVGTQYDPQAASYPHLNNADISQAVDNVLQQSGMPAATLQTTTCPATKDGNKLYNPPYADSAYPPGPGQAYLYICYQNNPGTTPPLTSPALTPLNVIVLYRFGLITGFLQDQLGPAGIEMFGQYQGTIE